VGRERHLAEQVIRRIAAEFQDRAKIQPYFWEYEPMESTRDYQENIPLTSAFDLVICILGKRLGCPVSVEHERPAAAAGVSGTEFELVTTVESKKTRGAPDIFIFKNDTKPTFEADEAGEGAKTELDLTQWKALIAFIKEWCDRNPNLPSFKSHRTLRRFFECLPLPSANANRLAHRAPFPKYIAALTTTLQPDTSGISKSLKFLSSIL
jgi:hypothetical protein